MWDAVREDPALQAALTFWHQGALLTTEFPSFALVAIAGAVEALTGCGAFLDRLNETPERCPSCGAVPRATARFWATIKLAASPAELEELQRHWNAYEARSQVAHGAQLHGVETALGPIFAFQYQLPTGETGASITMNEAGPAQRFVLHALPVLTAVAHRLLLQALRVASN